MDFTTILKIVQGAAGAGPAFGALFDQVKMVFSPADQATLQNAYNTARAASDAAEDDFVAAGRGD